MSGNGRDHTYNINYCSINYVTFFIKRIALSMGARRDGQE